MNTDLTAERLREILHYDPTTGIFIWLEKTCLKVVVGKEAGVHKRGYLYIGLFGKRYLGHRLAWLYMEGEWPSLNIDHKDGDPSNNRWKNLRAANQSQNIANSRLRTGKALLKGVRKTPSGTFQARIICDGRERHLGSYKTEEKAHLAYVHAARILHGEFACAG